MKSALIAFHRIHGSHDGKALARTVLALLDRADITVKVYFLPNWDVLFLIYLFKTGHFTMDNASNNATMMQELEVLLDARDIPFEAADSKIMCFAHVIDLSSGRVIRALADPIADDGEVPPPLVDPITHARKVVRAIRGSGMRRDAFEEVIVNGNSKGWFKNGEGKTVQIRSLQLLRDVRTRWDSVYHMLNRLRELRPVRHLIHHLGKTDLWLLSGCRSFSCTSK